MIPQKLRHVRALPEWGILLLRIWTGTDALSLILILGAESLGLLVVSVLLSWLVAVVLR